jgi:hypothetical protein
LGRGVQNQIPRACDQHDTCDHTSGLHPARGDGRARADAGNAVEIVFINEVRQRLDGRILRYTCREELLGLAEELGIGRFEANLLIAGAQHQAGAATTNPLAPRRRRGVSMIAMASAVLALQAVLLLGLWLILC